VLPAFEVGDAESLPYLRGQFDTTVTMFGAMFAFRPERAAAELIRVTRPGGRIAMANWTFEGFVGQMLRLHTAVVPPPQGVPSSLEWGKEAMVRARFGDKVSSVICSKRTLELDFPFPPAAVTELFANCYGPTVATLRGADPEGASKLREDLTRLFTEHNVATNGGTTVVGEYLDVQATVA
jgi:SAM-dependent methyltransferase